MVPWAGADDDSLRQKPKMNWFDATAATLCAYNGELFCPDLATGGVEMALEQTMAEARVRPLTRDQQNNLTRQLVVCAATGVDLNSATPEEREKGVARIPLPREATDRSVSATFDKEVKNRLFKSVDSATAKNTTAQVANTERLPPALQKHAQSAAFAWDSAMEASIRQQDEVQWILKELMGQSSIKRAKARMLELLGSEQVEAITTKEAPATLNLPFLQNLLSHEDEAPAERLSRVIAIQARGLVVATHAKAIKMLVPDLPDTQGEKHVFQSIPQGDLTYAAANRKVKSDLGKLESDSRPFKKSRPDKNSRGRKPRACRRPMGDEQPAEDRKPSAYERLGDKPAYIPNPNAGGGRATASNRGRGSYRGARGRRGRGGR